MRERRARRRRARFVTKSFFIALAGFAVGLGATTALTFISPEIRSTATAAQSPETEATIALAAPKPVPTQVQRLDTETSVPEIRQRLALAPMAPEAPPAPPVETVSRLDVPQPPAPLPQTAPPRPAAGPPMPAVKRTEIEAVLLPPPPPSEEEVAAAAAALVDMAEATRREQIEHDNVKMAALTPPQVLPPAPPPMAPAPPRTDSAKGAPKSLRSAPPAPAWRRYAALTPPTEGRARIAIVLDDMGLSQFRSDRAISLPRPITLAVLPYGNHLHGLVARARTAGHEVMLHLPMEPRDGQRDPGPNALLTGLPQAELDRRIAWNLGRLEGYVGVNNHMGSRFTASRREMARVMRALKARDLLFLDSLTTGRSKGYRLAREFGLPAVTRDIFLDNNRDPWLIRAQLEKTAQRARERGSAIAIGHPYPETLNVLEGWLPGLAARGLVLVPVSALVRSPEAPRATAEAKSRRDPQAKIGMAPASIATP